MKDPKILVVGATGLVGGEVCRLLAESGQSVRALVRPTASADRVGRLRDLGVAVVQGDLKDTASVEAACRNATAVISTASSTLSRQEGDTIDSVDRQGQLNLAEIAEKAGARQFILVSFPPFELEFPLQTAKRAVENRLSRGQMGFTILQPTCFMEIWVSPALGFDPSHGTVRICGSGQHPVSWISFPDVARFAVAALDNPRAMNGTFKLGGPDSLSPIELVRIAERSLGRSIEVQHVPEVALHSQYEAAADSLQRSMAALMLYCARGEVVDMTETLRSLPVAPLKSVRDHLRAILA